MPPQQQANVKGYGAAWSALVQMVRDGRSWSGRERNCAFLNQGNGRFANVSYVSGLDQDGDGRGVAVVDWDRDGDLDLWFRDRTAPRLRLMLNRHERSEAKGRSVALKFEGATANRDAIGAVVEVALEGGGARLVRSVRAGDLFLSQSSRWLQFADSNEQVIKEVTVLWPGGAREVFAGVAWGGRYVLKEGTGSVAKSEVPAVALNETEERWPPLGQGTARVLLPAPIPMPPLDSQIGAQTYLLESNGRPRVILVWSGSCEHCQRELETLAEKVQNLTDQGVEVVALSLDAPNDRDEAIIMMNKMGSNVVKGFLSETSLIRLDEFQRALFDQSVPLAVPLALFVDGSGNVASMYRGEIDWSELVADTRRLNGLTPEQRHVLAPPLAGKWFTKHVDPAFAVEFMARQFEARVPEDALVYLGTAAHRASGARKEALLTELVAKHLKFASEYRKAENPGRAVAHFEEALAAKPTARVYHEYGTMMASYAELRKAEELLSKALELDPGSVPTKKALALVRKLIAEGN